MEQPLVSIIIPTYNRAHLIGETLESVIIQSYKNWECIVVDDGSNDHTHELLEFYCEKDSRIKFYQRPPERPKGANACRNYGFEMSAGNFVNWFDDDDIMVPEFVEKKLFSFKDAALDFIISKSVNFKDPDPADIIDRNEYFYKFDKHKVTHFNYLSQKINWLTYDFMCRREIVESLKFNEKLNSAQERNFFTRLTCGTVKTKIIDEFLTLRRIHPQSIQSHLKQKTTLRIEEDFFFYFETWKDLKRMKCKDSLIYLFENAVKKTLFTNISPKFLFWIELEYIQQRKFSSAFWYFMYQLSAILFNRGHYFREKFKSTSGIY